MLQSVICVLKFTPKHPLAVTQHTNHYAHPNHSTSASTCSATLRWRGDGEVSFSPNLSACSTWQVRFAAVLSAAVLLPPAVLPASACINKCTTADGARYLLTSAISKAFTLLARATACSLLLLMISSTMTCWSSSAWWCCNLASG